MGLITKTVRDTLGLKAFAPGQVPQGGPTYSWLFPSDRNDPATRIGDGSGTSIAGATRNWFFRTFPEAEPVVTSQDRKSGQRVPIRPHNLTDLIDRPNDYYTGEALWAGMITSYLFDGNAYWIKARNASQRVAELWYAPHFLIEPKGSGDELIAFYRYTVAGRYYDIPVSEVVHVRFGIDPQNPRKGCSPLKEQLRELLTDDGAARFSESMLRNSAIPGIVVSPGSDSGTFDRAHALAAKAEFNQEFSGDKVGSTIVMSGMTKVEQVGFSPEQLTLRELRAIPEERVSAALGVPAAVLGLGAGLSNSKVGATMAEFREMATEQALVPMWKSFARQVSAALMYEFNAGDRTQRLEFDMAGVRVLQEDVQRLHERTRLDVAAGIVDVATSQARLGYPVDEAQRVYLRPPLMVEVPAAAPPGQQRRSRSANGKANGKLSSIERAGLNFVRSVDRGQTPITTAFTASLNRAFDDLGNAAADAYREAPKAQKRSPGDELLVEHILSALAIARLTDVRFRPMYGASYESMARVVIEGVETTLGVTLDIGVQDAIAERILAAGGKRVGLLDLGSRTRDALFRALEQARTEGLGVPDTARRIRDLVGAGPYPSAGAQYRAETIARTEMAYARNISVAETGRAAGFEEYLAFDDRTGFGDAECVARNGQTFTAEEMLSETGNEHPRGTLSFSPVPRTGV